MHEMGAELTGTFLGHVIPGSLLSIWGLLWFWSVSRELRAREAAAGAAASAWPVRAAYSRLESGLKLALPLAAAVGELWWASWRLTDTSVMNYQHATAYVGFFLAGVTDLLARRGRVAPYVPHLALALAFANAGFQFMAHGSHVMVSHAVHVFLVVLFMGQAGVVVMELLWRHPALAVAKAYGLVLVGGWFFQAAWILYRSGWDLDGPYHVMRVHLFFAWHVFGVAVGMALLHALLPRLPAVARAAHAAPPAVPVVARPGTAP